MTSLRSYLLPAILLAGTFGVALSSSGTDVLAPSATNPGDFNTFYAPAYRLPDPAGMSSSAASGKELIHSTYKYLGR